MMRIAQQDTNAFAQLLDHHLVGIRGYLTRLCGDPIEAEDLAQETFLKAWQQAGRYQPKIAKVSTWLYRIAHNTFVDLARRPSFQYRSATWISADDAAIGNSLDQQAQDNQALAWLQHELTQLPVNQRSAIALRFLQGQSNQEVAQILGISISAAESLTARARHTLNQRLLTWQARGNSPAATTRSNQP